MTHIRESNRTSRPAPKLIAVSVIADRPNLPRTHLKRAVFAPEAVLKFREHFYGFGVLRRDENHFNVAAAGQRRAIVIDLPSLGHQVLQAD